jgi:hypothetical protein
MANQTLSMRNSGHDESVRPSLVFFYDALGLLMACAFIVGKEAAGTSDPVRGFWTPIGFVLVA